MKRLAFIAVLLSAAVFCLPARAASKEREEQEKAALLTAGKAALEDGLYAVAAKNFDRYVRRASTDAERAEGVLLQARVLFGERRFQDMVKLLDRRAGWAAKTPSEAGFIYWKARAQYEQGAYAAALTLMDDLALRLPDSAYELGAMRLRAKCHLQLKNFDLALDEFRNFQKSHPDAPEAPDNLLDWGGALIELGARGDAAATLERLVAGYPASDAAAQAGLWLGDLYVGRGEWSRARDVLEGLAKRDGARADRRATAWFALARIYEAQTNVAVAVDAQQAWVAWMREDADGQRLMLARYAPDLSKRLQQLEVAKLAARGPASGTPRMVADAGGVWLAWTDVADGASRLQGARIAR